MACYNPTNKNHVDFLDAFKDLEVVNNILDYLTSFQLPINDTTLEQVLNNTHLVEYLELDTDAVQETIDEVGTSVPYEEKVTFFNNVLYKTFQSFINYSNVYNPDFNVARFLSNKKFREFAFNFKLNIDGENVVLFPELLSKVIENTLLEKGTDFTNNMKNDYKKSERLKLAVKTYFNKVTKNNILKEKELEENDDENGEKTSISAKRNDEQDFFTDAQAQIKLLTFLQEGEKDNTPMDSSIYLASVYNKLNLNDVKDFDAFKNQFTTLYLNNPRLRKAQLKIVDLANFKSNTPTIDELNLQTMLYTIFGKTENQFEVIKIFSNKTGGIEKISTAFINQNKEVGLQKFYNNAVQNVTDWFVNNKLTFEQWKDTLKPVYGGDLVAQLNAFFNFEHLDKYTNAQKGKIQFFISDMFKKVSELKTINEDTVLNAIKELEKKLKNIASYESQYSDRTDKVFDLTNANGDKQYSLSNLAWIHKQVDGKSSIGEVALSEVIMLNGMQTETNIRTGLFSDLNEKDQLMFYIDEVLHNNVLPFFNGDKTNEFAFKVDWQGETAKYADNSNNAYVLPNVYKNILDREVENYIKFKQLETNGVSYGLKNQMGLPTFLAYDLGAEYKQLYDTFINTIDASIADGSIADFSLNYQNVEALLDSYIEGVNKQALDFLPSVPKRNRSGTKINNGAVNVRDYNVKDMEQFFHLFTIGGSEIQAKITGSLVQYKDPTKRFSLATATKLPMRYDKVFINAFNKTNGTNYTTKGFNTLALEDNTVPKEEKNKDIRGFKGESTDAQAYLDIDFFKYILQASNRLPPNLRILLEEIKKTENDKSKTLTQKILYLNDLSVTLQEHLKILKPQYYGRDVETGLTVIYKVSVLPLSFGLTANKPLDKIRKLMQKNNIQMAVYGSGNKIGGKKINDKHFDIFTETGDVKENIEDINVSDYRQTVEWGGMGLQVEQPNPKKKVKLGVQIMNLADSGLQYLTEITQNGETEKNPEKVEAIKKEMIKEFNDLLVEKLTEQKNNVLKKFNLNEDFTAKDLQNLKSKDFQKLKSEILKLASSKNLDSSYLEELRTLNQYDVMGRKNLIQSTISAIVGSKILDLKITGDSKVMVSPAGFSLNTSNRLKFYETNADGSNTGIEILLPYDKKYARFLAYNEADNLFYPRKDLTKEELEIFKGIAYRIPTQPNASYDVFTIKGFLPAFYGNTIVVPENLPYKMGADFDVDKLNLLLSTFKDGKIEDTVDNKIIALYKKILSIPEYVEKLKTVTVDNTELKDAIIAKTGGSKVITHSIMNPVEALKARQENLEAKSTLGVVAVTTVHHNTAMRENIYFKENFTTNVRVNQRNYTEKLIDVMKFFDSFNGKIIHLGAKFTSYLGNEKEVSDILSQAINATVDATKDPYIATANFNLKSAGVGLLLLRSGISLEDVVSLLTSPSVVDYVKNKKDEQGISYVNTYKFSEYTDRLTNPLTIYKHLEDAAEAVRKLSDISRYDAKKVGKTIEENLINKLVFEENYALVQNIFENISYLENKENIQMNFRDFAHKGVNFTNNFFKIDRNLNALSKYFFPNEEKSLENFINKIVGEKKKTPYNLTKFKNEFGTELIRQVLFKNFAFKGKIKPQDILLKRIQDFVAKNPNNFFSKSLNIVEENKINKQSILNLNSRIDIDIVRDNFIRQYAEEKANKQTFIRDLVLFTYLTRNTGEGKMSLHNFIPHGIKSEIVFGDDSITDFVSQALASQTEAKTTEMIQKALDTALETTNPEVDTLTNTVSNRGTVDIKCIT